MRAKFDSSDLQFNPGYTALSGQKTRNAPFPGHRDRIRLIPIPSDHQWPKKVVQMIFGFDPI
jgi:hypothetical protein